jgi:hypothetical protein
MIRFSNIPALILLAFVSQAQCQYGYSTNADGTLTITNYTGSGGAVNIPTNINGRIVTGIGADAFYRNPKPTSVAIPETITSLGVSTFEFCTNMTSVFIPGSLTNIDGYAFAGCSGLTNATITDGIPYIGDDMFNGCHLLSNVVIPPTVTSIGDYAFYGCGMSTITILGNVTNFGDMSFVSCLRLTNATFSIGVPYIANDMFFDCARIRFRN